MNLLSSPLDIVDFSIISQIRHYKPLQKFSHFIQYTTNPQLMCTPSKFSEHCPQADIIRTNYPQFQRNLHVCQLTIVRSNKSMGQLKTNSGIILLSFYYLLSFHTFSSFSYTHDIPYKIPNKINKSLPLSMFA